MPKDKWRTVVEELLKRDSWIIDFGGTLDIRLACDGVVFLDLPRLVCLARVLKRVALYQKESRPDMSPGCPEKVDPTFLKYIWDYRKRKPRVIEKLKFYSQTKAVTIFKVAV